MAEEDNFSVYTEEPIELVEATTEADESTEEVEGSTTEADEETQKQSDETATSEEKPEAKEGHSRFQKRIDKITKQREDAYREAEELRKELEFYKSQSSKPKPTVKLDPLDFDSYDDYMEAVNAQTNTVQEVKTEPKQKETDPNAGLYRRLDDAFEDARDKYEDFDEVTRDPSVPFTMPMLEVIAELDNGGEVAYYLANNKDEVKKLQGLSAYRQAIEIGKLSDKLANPPKAEKKTTKAPDPIEPVTPKGDVVGKDPSKMSYSEYEAYMNNQTRKKGFW